MDWTRRSLIAGAGAGAVSTALATTVISDVDLRLPGGPSRRWLSSLFPQKGDMIVQRVRPPLLETPFEVFDRGVITPNDRFFVRWSGGDMPTSIDPETFRLMLRGAVKRPVQLTLAEVARAGETVEVTAVNQCAGNSRGFSQPRVSGAQWGHGAMGNAVWRGVRLKDVLDRAGVGGDAKRVRFVGLDKPLAPGAPQKIKSLPIDIARRDDVIIAWSMNGEMLPLLNGYPLRLVVPGWFATYWIKMLSDIEVLSTDEDDSYFMAKSYRMPAVPVQPGDKDFPTVPVTTMGPRSFVTSHVDGQTVPKGFELRGIAFGGDCGVEKVEWRLDCYGWYGPTSAIPPRCYDRHNYQDAELGPEEGPYGFRRWRVMVYPVGQFRALHIAINCTNKNGQSQDGNATPWNPSGYARNAVESINLVTA